MSKHAKEYFFYRMISVAFKSELSKLIQLIGLDKDTTWAIFFYLTDCANCRSMLLQHENLDAIPMH
jgi:hypothetical protein